MLLFLTYLNVLTASLAVAVYALASYRWARLRVAHLAVLNGTGALACLLILIGYIVLIATGGDGPSIIRPLVFMVLFFPALARFIELRREERREAFAREFSRELDQQVR